MIIRMCSLRIQNFDLIAECGIGNMIVTGSSMEGKVYEKETLSPLLHSSPVLGWSVSVNKTSAVTGNGFSLWSSWSWHVRWKQKKLHVTLWARSRAWDWIDADIFASGQRGLCVEKQKHYSANKGLNSQGYGLPKVKCQITDAFNCSAREDSWKSLG